MKDWKNADNGFLKVTNKYGNDELIVTKKPTGKSKSGKVILAWVKWNELRWLWKSC